MAAKNGQSKQKPAERKISLEFDQPVVNIGGDPANDIAISGEGVHPFHAALIIDGDEYRLVSLSPDAEILLDGQPVAEPSVVLEEDQRVDLGAYSLFVKPNGSPTSVHVVVTQPLPTEPGKPVKVPPRTVWQGAAGESLILANVLSKNLNVMVEQTASIELEIVNAGPIVANFDLEVDGVSDEWVKISPPEINLNEGQRAYINIEISPPRSPASAAGKHPIRLAVTSPNYPGQISELELELEIQPYYQFSLGKLTPKDQRIAWRAGAGAVTLPIRNEGNSTTGFEVMALDDENGCTFEIITPDEMAYARRAEVVVPAGAEYTVPIDITPTHRPMIALRSRQYHYNASVGVLQQANSTQMLSGTVTSTPLFGWWSIVLTLLVLAVALFVLVQPRIDYFEVADKKKMVINQGETTDLVWRVSPFATRLTISGVTDFNRSQGRVTVAPEESTTYQMVAGNWLSNILNMDRPKAATVLVVPPTPVINRFTVDSKDVLKGVPATIRWSVGQADTAFLTIDNVVEELPPAQFTGVRELMLKEDALVTLEARNGSGSQLKSYYINVISPEIFIDTFQVCRRHTGTGRPKNDCGASEGSSEFSELYVSLRRSADGAYRVSYDQSEDGGFQSELDKGEQVLVKWQVSGPDAVTIAPFNETLPAEGEQPFFPQESMNLVLTAVYGEDKKLEMLPIRVFDGQPPVAPTIDFFKASPSAIVGPGDVQFAWSISGAYTRITLNMGSAVIADNLKPQDFRTVRVPKTSTFILTAWNGTLSKAETLEVIVNPALKRTTLTIEDVTPHYTFFQVGDTVEVVTKIVGLDQETGTPAPTGKITVSDGTAVCTFDLPLNRCKLTFAASGTKEIKASYAGDKVYLPSDSLAYTKEPIIVDANEVQLTMGFYSPEMKDVSGNTVGPKPLLLSAASSALGEEIIAQAAPAVYIRQLGQGLLIDVSVVPVNKPIADDKGEITVRYCEMDALGNRIDTKCMVAGPVAVKPPTDPINPVASAKVVIGQFSKMGKFALLISYRHKDDAFLPVLIGASADDQIVVEVQKGKLVLVITDPKLEGFELCTYKLCRLTQIASTNLTFSPRLMVDAQDPSLTEDDVLADLYPTYPPVGQVKITATPAMDLPQDWTDKCGWQVVGVYQLLCQAVPLQKETVVKFEMVSASDAYAIDSAASETTIKIRAASTFLINASLLSPTNHYVGKKMQLMGGTVQLISDNVPNPTTYKISKVGGSLADDLKMVSGSCSLVNGALEVTQSSTPNSDSCIVYFNKAGEFNLEFKYDGTKEFAGVTRTEKITINKQTGITVDWAANPANKQVYVYSPLQAVLSFRCLNTATCGTGSLDFVYDVIKDAKLYLTPDAGTTGCTVSKDGAALDSSGTITVPAKGDKTYPEVSLSFTCTEVGTGTKAYTLAFDTSTSGKDFGFNPAASPNGSAFSFMVEKLNLTQTIVVTRDSLTNNLVSQDPTTLLWSISALQAGSSYHFTLTLPSVPPGITLNESTDWIEMRLPEKFAKSITYTAPDTTCEWNEAGYFFKFALSLQSGVWKSTTCKIFVNLPETLGADTKLDFSFTNPQMGITPTALYLPTTITAPQDWLVPDMKLVTVSGDWPTIYNSATPVYAGEIYQLSMRTPSSGYTWYTPYLEIPADLKGVLVTDTTKSTCLQNIDPTNSSRFFMPWRFENNNWIASCNIQVDRTINPDLTNAANKNKRFTYGLSYKYTVCDEWSWWFGWHCVKTRVVTQYVNLFTKDKDISRRPVLGLNNASLPNSVTGGANEWYAGTSPYVEFTISDEHQRFDAINEKTAANADPWGANVGGTALTCARQGTTSTIRCNIPDQTPGSYTLTLVYNDTKNFALTTHNYAFRILRIPTKISLADISLVGNPRPSGSLFPESYRCQYCGDKSLKYFLVTEYGYQINVKLQTDVTGVTVPKPETGSIALTLTVLNGDNSAFWSQTFTQDVTAANKGDVTFTNVTIPSSVTDGAVTRHLWGAKATFTVAYNGTTKYFASTPCCTLPPNDTIMVRRYLAFTPEGVQDASNKGFAVNSVVLPYASSTPLKEAYPAGSGEEKKYCLDVFFEAGTAALNCDGKSCWERNTTNESVAVFCDADSGPVADPPRTFNTAVTTDEKIYVADPNFNLSNLKYQIILLSQRYIGVVLTNWP